MCINHRSLGGCATRLLVQVDIVFVIFSVSRSIALLGGACGASGARPLFMRF